VEVVLRVRFGFLCTALFALVACHDAPTVYGGRLPFLPRRLVIIEGIADTLFQRSLQLVVRDTAASAFQYVDLVLDPGTANEQVISNKQLSAFAVPKWLEWLGPRTFRMYFPDTISPGPHRVMLREYDDKGLVDALIASFVIALPSVPYTLTVLPSLGGTDAAAVAINESGDIAGWSSDATGRKRAAVWHDGAISALDTAASSAMAMNNAGAVFGTVTTTSTCGARWSAGARTLIHWTDGSCLRAIAANDNGTVLAGQVNSTFLWRADGSATSVIAPGGSYYSNPADISDDDYIVGQGYTGGEYRAFAVGFAASFPGPFPRNSPHWGSKATHINNAGEFIGDVLEEKLFFGKAGSDPVILSGALSVNQRPTLFALNDSGLVASFKYDTQQGFLWKAGRTSRIAIASSGYTIDQLYAMNNARRIVGRATNNATGEKVAILLTPQ